MTTLRAGQTGQMPVPGTPAAADTRPGSGLVRAALGGVLARQPSLRVTPLLLPRGLGLLRQQLGWVPGPQSPRVQAAHQLASGPAEYFRVESPLSALPSLWPWVPEASTLSARGVTGHPGEVEKRGRVHSTQVALRDAEFIRLARGRPTGGKPGLGDLKDCLCASKCDQC